MVRKHSPKLSNKPKAIKYHNQRLILSMFREANTLSIADISTKIHLSKTSVIKVIRDFEAKGLINIIGKGSSTNMGGKKPTMFTFNASFVYVISLTISMDRISGALMDLKCNVIKSRSVACDASVEYAEALRLLEEMITGLINDQNLSNDQVYAIIIASEGIIDSNNCIIRYPIHHKWGRNLPLRDDLAQKLSFSTRIYVDNNIRLSGYARLLFKREDTYCTLVFIYAGQSASGSILENQRLVHGTNGFVGELGHMMIDPHSKIKCVCGGYGCFGSLVAPEAVFANAKAIYTKYPQSILCDAIRKKTLTMTDIFDAYNQNDPLATVLLDEIIHYFSIVIHNIVLLRDPQKIIIHGIYAEAGEKFLKKLQTKVNTLPFYKIERSLPIESANYDFNPSLIGAAYYAVDMFLNTKTLYD